MILNLYLLLVVNKFKKNLKSYCQSEINMILLYCLNGDVAQLARATGSYPVGRWFESTRRYQEEFCSNF